jgi:hypothetical protein
MATGQIDYDALVREAIHEAKRQVVRKVLEQVARTGLVGGHHFLIAFSTQHSGVTLSKRLREKYPVEMTIVLQHRFWDLAVSDDRFEVKLTFDSIPERLAVPFSAVKAFYDPSVPYMMPFDDGEAVEGRRGQGRPPHALGVVPIASGDNRPDADKRRERPVRRPRSIDKAEGDGRAEPRVRPAEASERRPAPGPQPPTPAPLPAQPRSKPALAEVKPAAEAARSDPASGAKVLDLSSFRGKKK